MKTFIHSVDTGGMVDGPGIRYVIFTQGCLLRCRYCHNPDTWTIGEGNQMSVDDLMDDIVDYLPFMKHSGGGVTVSGGEPLLHAEFLLELFKRCKQLGIHTTIDSSGGCFNRHHHFMDTFNELLNYTDLILLDLKHINSDKHKQLTGLCNSHILDMANYLNERNFPIWIRHVLVPGVTDFDDDLHELARFIDTLQNVQKVEVLPYHEMGKHKWHLLGLDYTLETTEPPSDERVANARRILVDRHQPTANV